MDILDILDKYCNPPFVTNTATQTYLTIIIHPVPVLSIMMKDICIRKYFNIRIWISTLNNYPIDENTTRYNLS